MPRGAFAWHMCFVFPPSSMACLRGWLLMQRLNDPSRRTHSSDKNDTKRLWTHSIRMTLKYDGPTAQTRMILQDNGPIGLTRTTLKDYGLTALTRALPACRPSPYVLQAPLHRASSVLQAPLHKAPLCVTCQACRCQLASHACASPCTHPCRGRPHWCHVHCVPGCRHRVRHPAHARRHCTGPAVQPHGLPDHVRHWLRAALLRCWLCAPGEQHGVTCGRGLLWQGQAACRVGRGCHGKGRQQAALAAAIQMGLPWIAAKALDLLFVACATQGMVWCKPSSEEGVHVVLDRGCSRKHAHRQGDSLSQGQLGNKWLQAL